ncbi:hypothetical protein ACA910_000414 [Epithemia clementina (nom. ined.)]
MGNCLPASKGELGEELFERLDKRLQDNEERLEKLLRELLEKRLQDNNKELLELLRDKIQFQGGIYYRKFKSIWKSEPKEFQGAAAEWKDLRQKDKVTLEYYIDPSKCENFRYCKSDFHPTNLFPPKNKSMAHLIPSDASCSLAWLRALSIVTGIDVGIDIPIRHPLLLEFVEGTVNQVDGQRTRRVADPLKTWKCNFLMLPNDHYKYLDQVSTIRQLIITPIWNPNKEWKPGTGYKIMVSADPESYRWLLGIDRKKNNN